MTSPRAGTSRTRRLAAVLGAAALVAVTVPAAQAAAPPAAPHTAAGGRPAAAATPYMGWNTYYGLGAPTEDQVMGVADYLVKSGLSKAGYDIVWLDGGWQADTPRDSSGRLVADPQRFPSGIPALVSRLHRLGLRVGIYTDAGDYDGGKSCGLGSRGHYQQDAKQFAGWKVDAIKVDFLCGISEKLDPATAFGEFSAAVAATGRPMLLNLCNPLTDDWGVPHTPAQDAHNAYAYGPRLATSWRTGTDIAYGTPTAGEWANVLRNMDANAQHPEAQGPGHYGDPDYLIPMRTMPDGSYELTQEESTTQLVMWAEMASPLIVGSDPRTLPEAMVATLANPEIVAVDQDPLDIQGVRVATDATGDVYSKVLSGRGKRAVVLLNRSGQAVRRTVSFADTGLGGRVAVRDLRARADRGTYTGSYTVTVPAHGTAFLKLSGTDAAPGAPLGTTSADDPALVTDGAVTTAFTRAADGSLRERTGPAGAPPSRVTDLGGPTRGGITGAPAAYGSPGGRIDVFVRGADDAAYRRTYDGRRWGRWQRLGGVLASAPAVAFDGPGHWTLFATGRDGGVLSLGPSGTGPVGAPAGLSVTGRPAAALDAAGRLHVAVRTNDDAVWERVRDASGGWSGWTPLGGTVSGSPALVAVGDTVRLYARASDYTLWQRTYSAHGDGGWGGWSRNTAWASGAFDGALGVAAGPAGEVLAAYRSVAGQIREATL
ncbi:glycoside hydrolase family 27 protein [Streptomyces sp. 8L]|uniref:glycoside hydrolase family 27 protein n=1 Tax=Streptomyces sp. 8L TaxID=2877242 RepID=UPI001CD58DF5|nr:glycoside hydrolase family 27 protein [Streptomyces sp. 8L]MCA1218467.1 glycoside hydrolase family 27 protein [Streptomyces sp. 8L]